MGGHDRGDSNYGLTLPFLPPQICCPPLGRFNSVDPSGLDAQDVANPQSWNLYSYVQDNPTNLADPTGLDEGGGGSGGSWRVAHRM